jgi:hypothetical protein
MLTITEIESHFYSIMQALYKIDPESEFKSIDKALRLKIENLEISLGHIKNTEIGDLEDLKIITSIIRPGLLSIGSMGSGKSASTLLQLYADRVKIKSVSGKQKELISLTSGILSWI